VSLQTSYPFVLPRGYVDAAGTLHKEGRMRLATARDELEPLRDPTVTGPDDPRLTVLVLARVVEKLGTVELVSSYEIEGLFAIDLAFLQDFYGVINFGNQEEYEELLRSQQDTRLLGASPRAELSVDPGPSVEPTPDDLPPAFDDSLDPEFAARPRRGAVEELPRRSV
jgi:hypothetical protein